ncbi:MAG: hypothetical protein GF384_03515 [Elusimicrobia bacterium]|nr:hypothetical protein [Elusimicrobiota bacterium]MBD3411982.1 hypothetical protein [Elusimicrobiota bacterium]
MILNVLHTLKKRFILAFLIFWIVVVVAALFTLTKQQVYKATAGIILTDRGLKENTFNVFSEALLLKTARKIDIVDENTRPIFVDQALEYLKKNLEASLDQHLLILRLSFTGPDPAQAAYIANVHAAQFIMKYAETPDIEIPDTISELSHYFDQLKNNLSNIKGMKQILTLKNSLIKKRTHAQKEKEHLLNTYTVHHPQVIMLNRRLKEIQTQIDFLNRQEAIVSKTMHEVDKNKALIVQKKIPARIYAGKTKLIIPAQVPDDSFIPGLGSMLGISIIIGMFLSVLVVYTIEQEHSLATTDEVSAYLKIPVLATIPHIERRGKKPAYRFMNIFKVRRPDKFGQRRSQLLCFHPLQGSLCNQYTTLGLKLRSRSSGHGTSLVVTSAGNREGKTINAINISMALALSGIKTLLIDGNMRYPAVHQLLGLPQAYGISDFLFGTVTLETVIRSIDECHFTTPAAVTKFKNLGLDNLHIITAGGKTTDTSLFDDQRSLSETLSACIRTYQMVIIDSASILHFDDVHYLIPLAHKTVMVYRSARLPRGTVYEALKEIRKETKHIAGIIINDIER